MNGKNVLKALALVFLALALVVPSFAHAATNLQVDYIKINGDVMGENDSLLVRRGDTLDIRVRLTAMGPVEEAQVEAAIFGYKYGDRERELVSDVTETFDLAENDTTYKDLRVQIPLDMNKKYTKLRIIVADSNGVAYIKDYQLHVQGVERDYSVIIQDFALNPTITYPGRSVEAVVRVKNIGDVDFDFVKVTVAVPDLGVFASQYLDYLRADDAETFEALLLRVPDCTEPGQYPVEVRVDFDKYGYTEQKGVLTVLADPSCVQQTQPQQPQQPQTKTVVTLPATQQVVVGTEVAYPIVVSNQGGVDESYTLEVSGLDSWATYRFEPGAFVVVPAGQQRTVYLYINPNEDVVAGEKQFTVKVTPLSNPGDAKTTLVSANVVVPEKQSNNLVLALEIILVILVILLVVLGVLYAKKGSEEKSEEEDEEYY